jgi:hypothetical protein
MNEWVPSWVVDGDHLAAHCKFSSRKVRCQLLLRVARYRHRCKSKWSDLGMSESSSTTDSILLSSLIICVLLSKQALASTNPGSASRRNPEERLGQIGEEEIKLVSRYPSVDSNLHSASIGDIWAEYTGIRNKRHTVEADLTQVQGFSRRKS